MYSKHFIQLSGLPFHVLNGVFQRTDVFNFDEVQLIDLLQYDVQNLFQALGPSGGHSQPKENST